MTEYSLLPDPLEASDADRAQTEALLNAAYDDGRISHTELLHRTAHAWKAHYRSELDDLIYDIGIQDSNSLSVTKPMPLAVNRVTGESGPSLSFALMGGSERVGAWTCPDRYTAIAVMGGVTIDLREAEFESVSTTITAFALMGGVTVIVPPGISVKVHGVGIMGGFGKENQIATSSVDGPVVHVTGLALMGGVTVEVKEIGEYEDE